MNFASGILNLIIILASITHITSCLGSSAQLTFAGIPLPNTPSILASWEFINTYLDEPTIRHVTRSALFALSTHSKIRAHDPCSSLAQADAEIIAVSALLHDMSWNVTWGPAHRFVSLDKRFEVDGANAAREFLSRLGDTSARGTGWDGNRLQLVWDAIALHTTASIGQYKQPEVVLSGYGIFLDVAGIANVSLPGIPQEYRVTQDEYDRVYAVLPAPGFTEYLKGIGIGLCVEKPETTYDNVMGTFGVQWVNGYSLVGHTVADVLIARAERENIQNFTEKISPHD